MKVLLHGGILDGFVREEWSQHEACGVSLGTSSSPPTQAEGKYFHKI